MGKKIINTTSSNSNVITNSNGNRNIHQIQNNNSKKEVESTDFYFNELMASMHQLTQEVKELKEQIKNKNS